MKKLMALALIFCLSVSPALAENRGSFTYGAAYETAAEARLLALECLEICGFSAEYGSDERDALVRWADRIYVRVKGSPTPEDREELQKFLTELSLRVPEMPGIFLTDNDDQANLTICYAPLSQLPELMPGYDSPSVQPGMTCDQVRTIIQNRFF